jgi:DNA polymerase-4
METRSILHIDLDTFFVSVERLINPKLSGIPVIVGGMGDRAVVASCSYEARKYGVHSAMPVKMARLLCPDAVFVRGDMDTYSKYSHLVTDIIAESSPVYEKASIDEHYIDISGMDRYIGTKKWAHQLRQQIYKETGLPLSIGLSINKTVSKIATCLAKPNGEKYVEPCEVIPFLKPLPVKIIPGIGEKTHHLLQLMGISTVGTLQQMPQELLSKVFGQNGITLWKRANGIDFTPVEPYHEQQSMSIERTFEQDTIDIAFIERELVRMVEQLAYELRQNKKLTGCITVKIRYSNFDTCSLQKKISYTVFDHELINEVKVLFHRLYQRRLLIRLIGIKFSHLINGGIQLSLFDNTQKWTRLYAALDEIRNNYGLSSIHRGSNG